MFCGKEKHEKANNTGYKKTYLLHYKMLIPYHCAVYDHVLSAMPQPFLFTPQKQQSPNLSSGTSSDDWFGFNVYISFRQPSTLLLLLVVSMKRIVDGEMQTTTLLALYSLTGDEVAHVYHIAQLAQLARSFAMLK